jgi:MFS family permease
MTIGRIAGPQLLRVVPRVAVVAGSAVFAGMGIVLIVVAPTPALAYAAVGMWGLGAALAFPVCISAAAEGDPATSSQRVGAVAATGYIGFLAGPAALGFLGEAVGIRFALLAVLALVVVAATLSPAVRPPRGTPATDRRAAAPR